MLVQDTGEIPIRLCVDKTFTWWLSALLILSLLIAGAQVMRMLQADLGNDWPGDGGDSGPGLVPGPPDPTPLKSRIQFKQVIHALGGAGATTGAGVRSRCASERKAITWQRSQRESAHVIRLRLAAPATDRSVQQWSGRH
jgi:hypothetical protein